MPGVLEADHDLVRMYVEAVLRYRQAMALLASSGPVVRRRHDGDEARHPASMLVNQLGQLRRRLARELNLPEHYAPVPVIPPTRRTFP
jgi:phage terminase small subunit